MEFLLLNNFFKSLENKISRPPRFTSLDSRGRCQCKAGRTSCGINFKDEALNCLSKKNYLYSSEA